MTQSILSRLFLSLYFLIPLYPTFDVIDKMAAHWLYFSLTNFLSIIFLYSYRDTYLTSQVSKKAIFPFLIFLSFIVCSIFSIINSINIIESLVTLTRWFTVFIGLLCVFLILREEKNIVGLITTVMISYLALEVLITLIQAKYFLDSNLLFNRLGRNQLFGFEGNKNINSASIALKVPFLLYKIYASSNQINKLILGVILLSSFFVIFLIGSRAILLSIFILVSLSILFLINKKMFKSAFIIIVPLIFSWQLSDSYLEQNLNLKSNIDTTINYNESESANLRLKYFSQAIKSAVRNPFFGIGIGNWKIKSLDYDSKQMSMYIVQYNTHNDFLEILAEIGFIGGLLYLLIYIYSVFLCIKNTLLKKHDIYYFLLLSLIVYLIDSSLNFPMMRALMQFQIVFILATLFVLNSKEDYETN